MTISDFIEKAIEGGWLPDFGRNIEYAGHNSDWSVWNFTDGNNKGSSTTENNKLALLDPKAWKAVGNVEGWGETVSDIVLGRNIRELRENKGITQAELGSIVGYTAMSISYIEHGIRPLKVSALVKMANYFEVPADKLMLSQSPSDEKQLQFIKNLQQGLSIKEALAQINN